MDHVLVGHANPVLITLWVVFPHFVRRFVFQMTEVIGIAFLALLGIAAGKQHVKLGSFEELLLEVRVAAMNIFVESGRFGDGYPREQFIVAGGMAVFMVGGLELKAQ